MRGLQRDQGEDQQSNDTPFDHLLVCTRDVSNPSKSVDYVVRASENVERIARDLSRRKNAFFMAATQRDLAVASRPRTSCYCHH